MNRFFALLGSLAIVLLVSLSGCGESDGDQQGANIDQYNHGDGGGGNGGGGNGGGGNGVDENNQNNSGGTDGPFKQEVSKASDWVSVAAGSTHQCGIKNDGSLWCWGANRDGQVGIGSDEFMEETPTQVAGSQGWAQVRGGTRYSCAIKTDGTLWCWGNNQRGQLGTGSTTDQNRPVQESSNSSHWAKVSTSTSSFTPYPCGIKESSGLYCWGANSITGHLGTGEPGDQHSPTRIDADAWRDVELADLHACAIKEEGSLWCWGANVYGQLGTGMSGHADTPTREATLSSDWEQVAVGSKHSCGLKTDGSLWCWGDNSYGQLGTGDTDNRNQPIQESTGASDWAQVTVGGAHKCAIKEDGSLWCWGHNRDRQIGDGTQDDRHTPTEVGAEKGPWSQVDALRGSVSYTCAVNTSNALYCWGSNLIW